MLRRQTVHIIRDLASQGRHRRDAYLADLETR